jgi:transcriptional regulator with XRE-family HTH domain
MSQSELAAKAGVGKRQIRRYESGETRPTLPIAKAIASAPGITIDGLAGEDTHRINLTGDWWACWQTWEDGTEVLNCHQISIQQAEDAEAKIHFADKQLVPNQSLRQTHFEWHIKEPEETQEFAALHARRILLRQAVNAPCRGRRCIGRPSAGVGPGRAPRRRQKRGLAQVLASCCTSLLGGSARVARFPAGA